MRSGLRVIDGDTCSATAQSRHLFPRLFFVGTSSGVAGEIHPGMILAQFIPSLPLEAGSSIEQPANICLSTRRRLAMAGWLESMTSTVIVRRLTGLRRCEPTSALIFGRRPLIGDWSSFASGFQKINICAKVVIAG